MKWTPIESQLPPYGESVLVSCLGGIWVMQLNHTNSRGHWFASPEDDVRDNRNDITHWMALPEPPPVTI